MKYECASTLVMGSEVVVVCRPPVEKDDPHAVSIVVQRPLYTQLPIRPSPRPPRVPQGNSYPHKGTVDRDGLLARLHRPGANRPPPFNGIVPRRLTFNWANSSKLRPSVACLVIMFRNRPDLEALKALTNVIHYVFKRRGLSRFTGE